MNKRRLGCVLLLAAFSLMPGATRAAQQNQPASQSTPSTDKKADHLTKQKDDVVRISVTLVQVDAVVTDKQGKPVTDLKSSDFEIYEDGRRQRITNFSYVSTKPLAASTNLSKAEPRSKTPLPPVPPVRLRPDQVRRTIALVVDDLGLSFESTAYVREALKKFVDEQMQPGDLVAIIRTGAGMGALQQFTADKRQLHAAIERVRWNPMGRGGVGAFAPIQSSPIPQTPLEARSASGRDSVDEFRAEIYSVGTLGAMNFVVRGLRELPGRKSVILFSDGFRLFTAGQQSQRVLAAVRSLIDLANRASVVIYTMDARGLQWTGLTAADDVKYQSPRQIQESMNARGSEMFESQGGLHYLAQETGGFFIHNNNDLANGIKRVLDDQRGYYLLGYVPEQTTFRLEQGQRRFHRIAVSVKTPGLKVRSRTGFYGVADAESRPVPRTPAQQVVAALMSPFTSGDVHLKLTSLFGHDSKAGSFVRSLLHIDARDLTFIDEPDGWHKSVLDIVAVTFGDSGRVVDQESRTHTVRLRGPAYEQALSNGFVYAVNVIVKKPGAYQLRTAVRDSASERVGSANEFIDVPDIGKNRLMLSGLLVSGSDPSKTIKTSITDPAAQHAASDKEGMIEQIDPLASPAVRIFRRGMEIDFSFLIYNAQSDSKTNQTRLESQVLLLRDGKQLFSAGVQPVDVGHQADLRHIAASGGLKLGGLEPGEYVLQIIISDNLAKEKYRTATQWIDFEIVN